MQPQEETEERPGKQSSLYFQVPEPHTGHRTTWGDTRRSGGRRHGRGRAWATTFIGVAEGKPWQGRGSSVGLASSHSLVRSKLWSWSPVSWYQSWGESGTGLLLPRERGPHSGVWALGWLVCYQTCSSLGSSLSQELASFSQTRKVF